MAICEYTKAGSTPVTEGIRAFFTDENLEKLKGIMYSKQVKAGSYLFWEGEPANHLYYMKKGSIKLSKTTDAGNKITLYIHHTGDLFGQITPFQQSLLSYDAEVTEDAEIGIIQQKDLEILLWQHGDLAVEFMKWMGMMHQMTQTKFRDLMMYGKPGALCSLLIRLSNSYGHPQEDGIVIRKRMTNAEMAEMVGATRESVNRMLNDMRKEEAITIDNGQIVIRNLEYLRDICHCEACPKEICRV
ncbi:Crp/Fnr family transcriptional regulator [Paenibacillus mucilaginosus]|uniref:Crp/Fnr family transcriptional regulator n=3 Tax=Paenibacillus mucilaginosus TaxID=61624 RepID=H6NEV9_9BACL|nr:Crp/Fnr family transcriptional regulator [Paenibacillus mucilaginosus]AEI39986.1 transcriptional regulator, Crp/Fnr family [Paenibacillus mucilaginosus KNP414]AFC28650.1 Crp/Fnr family transcriptional regulator [Paenibacillus mucilaginosus 3016]AFH60824.1 regulatory protein [Paenibacillus mucilaginosus K02]MCG7216407.1 Crp/Fnr family transcriptional regulator [Paenibacillus mucilaginosus]WDM29241.1 Crp/Fnr family transcriptional regulator [Paenibacillus mucilaginosus]